MKSGPIRRPHRVPLATYRLQFNRQFTFQQARDIVEYLRDLGISDLYVSPLFKAGPQSTHGYDICGFDQFNPALGDAADFDRLAAQLRELDLGLLLDMVPNHMGNDLSNDWWLDVLEKGPASPYASWFDIDWQPLQSDLRDKVLLPLLEDHYAKVLEAGKLRVVFNEGAFALAYYDKKYPLSPRSNPVILEQVLAHDGGDPDLADVVRNLRVLLEFLVRSDAAGQAERAEFKKVKKQLRQWHTAAPAFRHHLEKALQSLNGRPGVPESFNQLHTLLQQQHYRLAYWRAGPDEINYRRFFDITELVSLRMELPEVFDATHRLVFDLLNTGKVTGLRIDHPDGLWNPKQYFERLQDGFRSRTTHHAPRTTSLFIVAEKILTGDEPLPPDWPIAGTTGYDYLNRVNGLFIQRAGQMAFDQIYRDFTGNTLDFPAAVRAAKKQLLRTSFISELNALALRLKQIAQATRYGQDFTFRRLHTTLAEMIAAFPVYRTYATDQTSALTAREQEYVKAATRAARLANPRLDPAIAEFVENLLLLHPPPDLDDAGRQRTRQFVLRFQQLTGPVMAKGLEDTTFYNFNRFVSLNEVGGDPDTFGTDLYAFHDYNAAKAEHWPHSLLATATHDTKRGEDLRVRLNVLSEMSEEWRDAVLRWARLNADKKSLLNGQPAPHPNDEYLLYQTLVGAWLPEADWPRVEGRGWKTQEPPLTPRPSPLSALRDRVAAYMLKAIKEAKTRTSWTNPNSAYEEATRHFVESVLTDYESNRFLDDFRPFQQRVAFFGRFNSLAQTLLKLTSPGVPDFYQGTELWDFSLVDPDNRRPVDYTLRRRLLADLKVRIPAALSAGFPESPGAGEAPPSPPLEERVGERRPPLSSDSAASVSDDLAAFFARLLEESGTGQIKQYLIWRTLQFRRRYAELFETGAYVPLLATGAKAEHVCAFARTSERESVLILVPRLIFGLTHGAECPPLGPDVWQDTLLPLSQARPGETYRNVLTGETISVNPASTGGTLPVSAALARFPVAVLERVS